MKISVRDRENYLKNMESADAIEPGTITIAQEMRNDKKPDFCFMKEGDIFNWEIKNWKLSRCRDILPVPMNSRQKG